MLVVITFDESDVGGSDSGLACCNEQPGPNTHAPGNAGDATDARHRAAARSARCC